MNTPTSENVLIVRRGLAVAARIAVVYPFVPREAWFRQVGYVSLRRFSDSLHERLEPGHPLEIAALKLSLLPEGSKTYIPGVGFRAMTPNMFYVEVPDEKSKQSG